uniref:Retrotransposon gag domain-containing protein n=1 Tax=Fagus sylvatica TaxID=28930 RepID=A0A2N9IWJ5_FAGSY
MTSPGKTTHFQPKKNAVRSTGPRRTGGAAKYSTPEEGPREGGAHRSRETSFLREARKKRRIEELKLLKGGDENRDEQRRSRQSRSYSGSCGSPHPVPSPKGRGRESDYRRRRKVSPKGRRQRHSKSPRQEQNPIWRKLQQISHSPFSARIERAKFPARFVTPPLAVYDGKSDPVGHLSRFRQSMAIHNNNDALMCRVFPSSLGEVGLRWFDRLEHGSIRSWKEMSKIFTARFITNTRKPKEIDSLLALTKGEIGQKYVFLASTTHKSGLHPSNATWEVLEIMEMQFPRYALRQGWLWARARAGPALRDKCLLKGEGFVTYMQAQEDQQVSNVGPTPEQP